jgi:hypothetical protein
VEQLIEELETVRQQVLSQTDSVWVQNLLPVVKFEESRKPNGIAAEFWGRNFAAFENQTLDPVVRQILTETHQRYGIPGVVQDSGNGRWLFYWDDQS